MALKMDLNINQVTKDIDFINEEYPKLFNSLSSMNNILDNVRTFWKGKRYTELITAWNSTVDKFLNPNLTALANSEKEMARIFNNFMAAEGNSKRANNVAVKKLTPKNPDPDVNVKIDTAKISTANSQLVSLMKTAIKSTDDILTKLLSTGWQSNASNLVNLQAVAKKAKSELPPELSKLQSAIDNTISADARAYENASN